MTLDTQLVDWRSKALQFEQQLNQLVLGQHAVIRHLLIAVFARGHVLLEGNVGVGKTTLLRAVAQGLGGAYQRIEGTIDLMPADLLYYTYLERDGKPRVDAGPLLRQGEKLATFFFNEINRARPQVHSLLLRAMAERSVNAFNQDHQLPHIQVFADRNRVEKEETFELPAAAKDRFMMEINVDVPSDTAILDDLMFSVRFHDTDKLLRTLPSTGLAYYQLNEFAELVQQQVQVSERLRAYALALWQALQNPQAAGMRLTDVAMDNLLVAGVSPRGVSYWIRAAKVRAWLENRNYVLPEDLQDLLTPCLSHRLFLSPLYSYRREQLLPELFTALLQHIAAP